MKNLIKLKYSHRCEGANTQKGIWWRERVKMSNLGIHNFWSGSQHGVRGEGAEATAGGREREGGRVVLKRRSSPLLSSPLGDGDGDGEV